MFPGIGVCRKAWVVPTTHTTTWLHRCWTLCGTCSWVSDSRWETRTCGGSWTLWSSPSRWWNRAASSTTCRCCSEWRAQPNATWMDALLYCSVFLLHCCHWLKVAKNRVFSQRMLPIVKTITLLALTFNLQLLFRNSLRCFNALKAIGIISSKTSSYKYSVCIVKQADD